MNSLLRFISNGSGLQTKSLLWNRCWDVRPWWISHTQWLIAGDPPWKSISKKGFSLAYIHPFTNWCFGAVYRSFWTEQIYLLFEHFCSYVRICFKCKKIQLQNLWLQWWPSTPSPNDERQATRCSASRSRGDATRSWKMHRQWQRNPSGYHGCKVTKLSVHKKPRIPQQSPANCANWTWCPATNLEFRNPAP